VVQMAQVVLLLLPQAHQATLKPQEIQVQTVLVEPQAVQVLLEAQV
jgi:hypothetical protein